MDEHEAGDPRSLRWAIGPWSQLEHAARAVRRQVFAEELGIEETTDFDGSDDGAIHVVAFRAEQPVATGRLLTAEGRIGRMAVVEPLRGSGVGSAMLQRLLREAVRLDIQEVTLHAQEHAIGFYRQHGFSPQGERFEEAGIPHQMMRRRLAWREAVAGVVVREGCVLLGLRAPQLAMGGRWDLFGGKIEPGEEPLEALRRELREETSLEVKPDRLLDVILYEDARGPGLWRCPVYRIVEWTGQVSINEEHVEARWVRPEQMAALRLAHHGLTRLAALALTEVL
jgi:8-oxo-dGTP pyrophosphatase MutT (NUDIX family)/predicted GNAT family N-acyltransferase